MSERDIVKRLWDYGLTLDPDVVICDRRVVDEAADLIERQAARIAELEAQRAKAAEQATERAVRAAKFKLGGIWDARAHDIARAAARAILTGGRNDG